MKQKTETFQMMKCFSCLPDKKIKFCLLFVIHRPYCAQSMGHDLKPNSSIFLSGPLMQLISTWYC